MKNSRPAIVLCLVLLSLVSVTALAQDLAKIEPLAAIVDLNVGETAQVKLSDGSGTTIKVLEVREVRDTVRNGLSQVDIALEVDGAKRTITSANYRLPITIGKVQLDCPVTRAYVEGSSNGNVWALDKDVRLRLWPAGSPWIVPGTFGYPLKQRWFASLTQMANEPVFVDGGVPRNDGKFYYHYGLDFGGCEGLVEVVAATDGLVVSAANETLPAHASSPAKKRYDVVYLLDGRGWYYRYSHLKQIDVKLGQTLRRGERIGLLGKEGASGGWSHLHFDISTIQPSGRYGIQDGYAFIWDAYCRENQPAVVAVARPHHRAAIGETIVLDAAQSWAARGPIASYEWTFCDGTTSSGAKVERQYKQQGTYSEILRVTDSRGKVAYDFAIVKVYDPQRPKEPPPGIHATFYPTTGIRAGQAITFKVRTFNTTYGQETWDFGDGSPPATVQSDGNKVPLNKDGYAQIQHSYANPGQYLARVERSNERGEKAITRLWIEVQPAPFKP